MKQINNYWVDENNNKWNCELYTEEQAEKYSKTLINCTNCTNCDYCTNCTNCDYCTNCTNCDYCTNCTNCDYCDYCTNCDYHKSNPQRYVTSKIGSRNGQTTFYYLNDEELKDKQMQIVCGCFRGNLEEFEKAVLETHKDNEKYREQYLREIEKVKMLFDLEDRKNDKN